MRKQSGFTYINQQNFDEFNFVDERKLYYAEIGSDVWIGARVVLVGGVRIGHGAIIATGSVVTKDVEDYAVVAGVPAKHIRYRFHEERRCALLKDPWWDKSEDWICENLGQFTREL
ncbi:MAG: CatB-related O-acetyltransferase [Opitutae bacterium]|nr:CatB-related O-acetyltransferase [Opitutae bacterium]